LPELTASETLALRVKRNFVAAFSVCRYNRNHPSSRRSHHVFRFPPDFSFCSGLTFFADQTISEEVCSIVLSPIGHRSYFRGCKVGPKGLNHEKRQ
jgi:hypothetical protein